MRSAASRESPESPRGVGNVGCGDLADDPAAELLQDAFAREMLDGVDFSSPITMSASPARIGAISREMRSAVLIVGVEVDDHVGASRTAALSPRTKTRASPWLRRRRTM
jgi:hypothetical protein